MRIFNRLNPHELSAFLSNLSSLLASGLTSLDALETLAKICGKSVKNVCLKLLAEVRNGADLSDAFAKQRELNEYASAVKAGEQSGKLPEVLRRISERISRKNQTAAKLKTAMYYPAFILVLTFAVSMYMLRAIVPKFQTMLAETSGGSLPPLTIFVVGLSESISKHWLALILFTACGILALRWLIKNPFKMRFAAFTLKIPIIGEIIRSSEFADFFDNLSFLIDAGLTVSQALKSAADAVKNPHIKSQLNAAYREMTGGGKSISAALSGVRTMNEIERQCIAVAERSGNLCGVLRELSSELLAVNEQLNKRLTALFEPMLTVLIGAVVGIVMLAMYMPVISVMQI